MSLKSLIQRLLDSRTTPEEAGHFAMPSSTPTTISSPTSITSWGTITTFTAPDDGYVTFHGRSMAGAAAQIASLPLDNNPTVITATQDNYQGMSCNLPVVKGKTVEVYGSNIENIVVSFNRLIGGGHNYIFWRALSCLKPLSNYLPKVSSRANQIGLAAKHSQVLHQLRSLSSTQWPTNTRRLKTGTSVLEGTQTLTTLLSAVPCQVSLLILKATYKLQCLLRKALPFAFIAGQATSNRSQQVFIPCKAVNLSTGGELC